ncbi:MAG: helix-turn-helix domain-containing protein [Pseudonocardia sp.]
MDEGIGSGIGQRLREIRLWRGLSLRAAAGLAGFSASYLSMIENGKSPVDKRSTLEAFASALRVAPSELMATPWGVTDSGGGAHGSVVALEAALDCYELGEDPGGTVREWSAIATDVERLVDFMHVSADYAAQGEMVPRLLAELHGAYVRLPGHRQDVLLGLIHCYSSVCWVTKRLGGRGLPLLAARLTQRCAAELDVPQWRGYATWLRGEAVGQLSRPQHYQRAVRMADDLTPALDSPEVMQAYGMLHLSAALAAAVQADRDTAATHLDEAADVAARMEVEVGGFARLWFGATNVGIWRTSLAVEFGDGSKVAEIAREVHVDIIPSPSRRAEFYSDLGRSMLWERSTAEQGLALLLRAERLAPQRVRNDVFVRETVTHLLPRARRDAAGRELRGLAFRMGIAG